MRPLILVLALSLVVWLLVTPRSVETEPPRVLTENDMAEVSVITRVEARPPSLYVTLSEIGWREMNSLQRWQLLEHIGAIAASADYVGAQVRTNDGRTVGQWSKAGGAKAVQQAPGDS